MTQPIASWGTPVTSLDALVGTTATNGNEFSIPGGKAAALTWTTSFSSAPSAVSLILQLSLDGITWFTGDTSTVTAGEARTINTSAKFFRVRLASKTGGGTTTAVIVGQPYAVEINNYPAGAGAIWGLITGTLADQTDLQTALDAKITAFADPNADRIVFWDDSAGAFAALTPGTGLSITTTSINAVSPVGSIPWVIDGGGAVIATGVSGFIQIPFACTLTGWTILSIDTAATVGAIVIDIWKNTYTNFPPTNSDSITNGHEPLVTASANKNTDADISDWTSVAIAAGDVIGYNVDSVAGFTKVLISLNYTKA